MGKTKALAFFSPPVPLVFFFLLHARFLVPGPSPRKQITNEPKPPSYLDVLVPLEPVEALQQPVGVRSDPQHPLLHRQPDHRMPATLAHASDDLLVGQDRAQGRAPVDRDSGLVGEALFEELQEDPLRPFVIARVCRRELSLPVVGEAEGLELLAEAVDVLLLLFFCVFLWRERGEGGGKEIFELEWAFLKKYLVLLDAEKLDLFAARFSLSLSRSCSLDSRASLSRRDIAAEEEDDEKKKGASFELLPFFEAPLFPSTSLDTTDHLVEDSQNKKEDSPSSPPGAFPSGSRTAPREARTRPSRSGAVHFSLASSRRAPQYQSPYTPPDARRANLPRSGKGTCPGRRPWASRCRAAPLQGGCRAF